MPKCDYGNCDEEAIWTTVNYHESIPTSKYCQYHMGDLMMRANGKIQVERLPEPKNVGKLTITLSGPCGCGKTAIANIIAKLLSNAKQDVRILNSKTGIMKDSDFRDSILCFKTNILIIDIDG